MVQMLASIDPPFLITVIGVAVAVTSLWWTITLHLRRKRKRVAVGFSLENGFRYKDNAEADEVRTVQHHIFLTITNAGPHGCFVELPCIWTSRKIKGEQLWVLFEGGEEELSPELKPGERLEKRYPAGELVRGFVSHLKDRDTIRFVVEDSLGHRFTSNKLSVKKVKEFANRPLETAYKNNAH